jgi:hypothetical protein
MGKDVCRKILFSPRKNMAHVEQQVNQIKQSVLIYYRGKLFYFVDHQDVAKEFKGNYYTLLEDLFIFQLGISFEMLQEINPNLESSLISIFVKEDLFLMSWL